MKTLNLILTFFLFLNYNPKKDSTAPKHLVAKIDFYPSFHYQIMLTINIQNDTGYVLSNVVSSKGQNISVDSALLSKQDIFNFFNDIDTLSLLNIPSDTSAMGNDGITIKSEITLDEKHSKFVTWSPERKSRPSYYLFFDAVFKLTDKEFPTQVDYFENVQAYLSYQPYIKEKKGDPLVIKMYGGYSIDDAEMLENYFDSLPKDKPIIMDLTNLMGIGGALYDDFVDLEQSHPKLVWVISNRDYFKNVGLKRKRIFDNIDLALKFIKK